MRLILHVWRQRAGSPGGFQRYEADDLSAHMSFLEMLDVVNGRLIEAGQDPIAFEHDCREGICGACGMVINGEPHGPVSGVTVCQLHLRSFRDGQELWVEPWRARSFPVIKDLVVDMEPFFAQYRSVLPFFINDSRPPERERIQTVEDRERFDDTTKCILCAACTTSCPSFWADGDFVGPAAIVNAHRFIFDSRDEAAGERLDRLNDREGVWRCRTVFNCVEACPRGIDVTGAIGDVKRELLYKKS